jgi:ATP-dependent DNA helicase 2 subunit 2
MLILDQFPKKSASQRANSQSQRRAKDEDDDSELLLGKAPANENGRPDPDDTAMAVDDVDPGRAPGRIIGSTFPLQDFRENIARGDLVTKAVADLAFVIQDVVLKPFASRRHAEMIECLQALRDTALKVSVRKRLERSVLPFPHRRMRLTPGTRMSDTCITYAMR